MAWREDRIRLEVYLTQELANALDAARGNTPRATFVQQLLRKLRASDSVRCRCGQTTISITEMNRHLMGLQILCDQCGDVVWPRSKKP